MEDITDALQKRNDTAFLKMVNNARYIKDIKGYPWDIMSYIINLIETGTTKENVTFQENLLKGFHIIAENLGSDDMVLILIKEIGNVKSDGKFLLLLKLTQKALVKLLATDKITYLAWSLNAVQTYLSALPAPENFDLEDKETLLMDADENVARISSLYYRILPFYDELFSIIIKLSCEHKLLFTRSIIQLLRPPLAYLDMDADGKPKSKARIVAEELIHKIIILSPNTYAFLKDGYCEEHEDIVLDELALSVFFYLHLGESVGLANSPKIYDPLHIFQTSLTLVVPLFSFGHQFLIEKGIKLMSSLLKISSHRRYPYQVLDSCDHSMFCQSIAKVIIYNKVEVYRKKCLKILHDYLFNFDSRGRYLLIYSIIKNIENISLSSYLITQYKQMLVDQFDRKTEIEYHFRERKLFTILGVFCYLPEGAETDLIEYADQVIASLNLLRYLVLRDNANVTRIQDHIKCLQKSFLEPLRKGLSLSKGHYKLKLQEIQGIKARGDKSSSDNKVSVSVEGKGIPELTPIEQVKVVNSSLTALDVIDSLLSRLNECIEYNMNVER